MLEQAALRLVPACGNLDSRWLREKVCELQGPEGNWVKGVQCRMQELVILPCYAQERWDGLPTTRVEMAGR
jgi:hypothetical protein